MGFVKHESYIIFSILFRKKCNYKTVDTKQLKRNPSSSGIVAHIYNPGTQEAKAGHFALRMV